jgi:hypothetical protein
MNLGRRRALSVSDRRNGEIRAVLANSRLVADLWKAAVSSGTGVCHCLTMTAGAATRLSARLNRFLGLGWLLAGVG